jgi:hypothetical protein
MKAEEVKDGLTQQPGRRAVRGFPLAKKGRGLLQDGILKERHQLALLLHVQPSRVTLLQGVAEEKCMDHSAHDGVVRVGQQSRDASEYALEILPGKTDPSRQTRRRWSLEPVFLLTEETPYVGPLGFEFSSTAGGSRGTASAQSEIGRGALGNQLERISLADDRLRLESMIEVDPAAPVAHQKDARAVTSFREDLPLGKQAEASHRSRVAKIGMLTPALRLDLREVFFGQRDDASTATAGAAMAVPVLDDRE